MDPKNASIGQIYLQSRGTPVGGFQFIVDRDRGEPVEIGTAVAVDSSEGIVVGIVTDMAAVGWSRDPFAADLLGEANSLDRRDEVLLATAQVFSAPRLRPVRSGPVRAATAQEVQAASGSLTLPWGIPAGAVDLLDGSLVPVKLDGYSLLGSDAAHCLVGGISGQASKTSFAGVLLRSAIASGSPTKDSVAAVLFNVKGEDLLFMDQPPGKGYELTDTDLEIYAALGLDPTPFPNVTVYAPPEFTSESANSPREDARSISWSLTDVWSYLRYIWPIINEDDKLAAFFASFAEKFLYSRNPATRIDSYNKLMAWFQAEIAEAEQAGDDQTRGTKTHVATMRRIARMFNSLPSRLGGLVSKDGETSDVPTEDLIHGQVLVVDVASIPPIAQGMVVARTVERLLKAAEEGSLGVDHLVVFADELNTFAPAQGGEVRAVKRILQRVVTQGRYAGVSLWGAAQKLSKIDDLVRDNAATIALGRTAPAEIDSGAYGKIPAGLAEQLATLGRGQVALWHYTMRSAMVVRFPRPAWRTGRSEKPRSKKAKGQLARAGLSKESIAAASEGLSEHEVEGIVNASSDLETAVEALKQARRPDPHRVMLQPPKRDFDPANPFDLD